MNELKLAQKETDLAIVEFLRAKQRYYTQDNYKPYNEEGKQPETFENGLIFSGYACVIGMIVSFIL